MSHLLNIYITLLDTLIVSYYDLLLQLSSYVGIQFLLFNFYSILLYSLLNSIFLFYTLKFYLYSSCKWRSSLLRDHRCQISCNHWPCFSRASLYQQSVVTWFVFGGTSAVTRSEGWKERKRERKRGRRRWRLHLMSWAQKTVKPSWNSFQTAGEVLRATASWISMSVC